MAGKLSAEFKWPFFFFFINLRPVCFSSGNSSAFKAYCAINGPLLTAHKYETK
jgi:hypothetical protein